MKTFFCLFYVKRVTLKKQDYTCIQIIVYVCVSYIGVVWSCSRSTHVDCLSAINCDNEKEPRKVRTCAGTKASVLPPFRVVSK